MTLAKAIEAAREILESVGICINLEAVHDAIDKALDALPDKPKSESEILKIISLAIYNSPDDGEAHHVLRALTKANVLYCEEK